MTSAGHGIRIELVDEALRQQFQQWFAGAATLTTGR
jgi:hypothetical protein